MSDDTDLKAEIDRLRNEVEAYRQREIAALQAALAAAREDAAHYRQEAYKNADIGRQIAAGYKEQVDELRKKLETFTNPGYATSRQVHAARN